MDGNNVRDFYDGPGWELTEGDTLDAVVNENLTRTASEYVSQVRARIGQKLGSGEVLLDIGCGPIQYPEYVDYSQNFEKRICVDLSEKALVSAKEKIGSHGEFIVGDYLDLPTPEMAPFDGATLINVLYHVKKDRQAELVRKILKDLKPGKCLLVVYSNPRSLSSFVTRVMVILKHRVSSVVKHINYNELGNPIYFYRFPRKFWRTFEDEATVDVFAWRTFAPALEKILFRKYLGGKLLFRLLFKCENIQWWQSISEYQLIVLRKPEVSV